MFNGSRLNLARKRRRVTARILAQDAEITPVMLSRILNGTHQPDVKTVEVLASALKYPVDFFFLDDIDEIDVRAASFRSLTSMMARERDASLAAGSLAFEISDWVSKLFKLPDADLIDLGHERDQANAARVLRQYWCIGEKPLGNIVNFLETKGVRIFSLSENTKNVDAFSCWRNAEPFIFLNTYKTTERSRFDAAHELGHLVLHKHGGPNQRDAENQANLFASSFLMPHADVIATVPYAPDLKTVIRAKKKWGVSASALSYRLHKLGVITDWQYRTFMIQLNSDYNRKEPDGLPAEKSHVWKTVLQELWRDGKTMEAIGRELKLPSEEVGSLLFGLTAEPPPSRKTGPPPTLRQVK
jgi:Zn-dependent peptidase ImmA (M78 family)